MKKIYLEKQFMKATGYNNFIIGEVVAHSKERGEYQIKKDDGNIITVFAHSILGWEEYKGDSEVGYRFHYHAKEDNSIKKPFFYCDVYQNGKFLHRYCYGFDWVHVLNSSESFGFFLLEKGDSVKKVFEDSWYKYRGEVTQKEREPKFDIYIKRSTVILKDELTEQKEDTYTLVLKNNESDMKSNLASSGDLQKIENMKDVLTYSFQNAGVKFKVYNEIN